MEPHYLQRFAELYEKQGRFVEVIDGKYWVSYGKMIVPIGPININYSISKDKAHQLLKKVPGALMVRYTDGLFGSNNSEAWYAVICDSCKDLKEYPREGRRGIKRGLENCDIRQVDAGFIAKSGYEVYTSAFSRYQDVIKPIEKDAFASIINAAKDFDDIYQYWGIFYDNSLIAYSTVAVFGNEEAAISVAKFMPDYLKYYPSNAMFYTLIQHYLGNKSVQYINAGFRNLYHKTNMHEYLIKKLIFQKVPLNLSAVYSNLLACFIKITYPLHNILSKSNYKLKVMFTVESIRKQCELNK